VTVAIRGLRHRRTAAAPAAATVEDRPHPVGPYVGLVTRTIAFGLDAAIINLVAIVVGGVVALGLSVLKLPDAVKVVAAAAGGVVYFLWLIGYFVTFWTTTGQTPGDRLLRIRVVPTRGDRLLPRRALLRVIGLTLAALPLFAGYLIILIDDRRRGLHDRLARTVVVEAPTVRDAEPGGRREPRGRRR
jgi:uncharacterized RDD family membrane protein YckC